MINLIPPHAQISVKKEYWIRVISVWAMLVATACSIVIISSMPVYVLVRTQLEAFANEYEQMTVESESFEASQQEIAQANEMAVLLASGNKNTRFSSAIQELELLAGEGITITEFTLSQKTGSLEPIAIKGVAASRFALTSFQERIIAHELFETADLPLSNLARDRDIAFSITITPQAQE